MKEIMICRRKRCGHFVIERLIREFGGLGSNDFKIKSKEEFYNFEKKIEKLDEAVKKFESRVVDFSDVKGFYPCDKYMEICWGRRKYLACVKVLAGKRNLLKNTLKESKLEVEK